MRATPETSEKRRGNRIEAGTRRVRVYLGGQLVADTVHPMLVWEVPYYPTYYFRLGDVRTELLEADGGVQHSPSRGDGRLFAVSAGGFDYVSFYSSFATGVTLDLARLEAHPSSIPPLLRKFSSQ